MARTGGGGGEFGAYFEVKQVVKRRERSMSLQFTVNYPDTFPDALGRSREQFEQEAKWAMVVKLFELKRLSSGMAAALIGVDRVTFLLKLGDYGIPMIDLTEAELLSDLGVNL
jgi:predicted HTH domain antitoxin